MKGTGPGLQAADVTINLPLWVDHIHCFLFKGDDGWDILDTGIYTPRTMAKWKEAFLKLKINPLDVRKIVITHDHVDHFGAAGELQKLTRAPVQMDFSSNRMVFLKEWLQEVLEDSAFKCFGLPEELQEKVLAEKVGQFKSWAPSVPDFEDISGQERIMLGSECYQILRFAGHGSNQLCFYQPEQEVLFAGDVLVTPNHLSTGVREPLKDYFDSLELLQSMKIKMLVPSHGKPFSRVGIRIGLIAEYRRQQLGSLQKYLVKAGTVYEAYLFLLSSGGALSDLFFGLAEVYCFLEYLVQQGDVHRVTGKECLYYQNLRGGEEG